MTPGKVFGRSKLETNCLKEIKKISRKNVKFYFLGNPSMISEISVKFFSLKCKENCRLESNIKTNKIFKTYKDITKISLVFVVFDKL